jgi:hypothetical protein
MFFLSAPTAEADIHAVPSGELECLANAANSLEEEKVNDMSLVFSAR